MIKIRKWALLAVGALLLVVLISTYLLFYKPQATFVLPKTGTWKVTDSNFVQGLVDFEIALEGAGDVSYYELYAEDILIGERTPITKPLTTISLLLSEPQCLRLKLFKGAAGGVALASAVLYPTGQLGIFWATEDRPAAAVICNTTVGNGVISCKFNMRPEPDPLVNDFSIILNDDKEDLEWPVDLFYWDEIEHTAHLTLNTVPPYIEGLTIVPVSIQYRNSTIAIEIPSVSFISEEEESYDENLLTEGNNDKPSDEDNGESSATEVVGYWTVQPIYPDSVASDLTITLNGYEHITHFELFVLGNAIDNRTPISESIRTAGILFSIPEDIEIHLFAGSDVSVPDLKVQCLSNGDLVVLNND